MTVSRKKLIEVALPLDAINSESLRRKQKAPKGWPTSFHKWWAQRPIAAARAVIFAQMVDDPSSYVDVLLSDSRKKKVAERELEKRLAEYAAKKSLADDDSISEPESTLAEVIAEIERNRLFKIIEELVLWDNTANEAVVRRARDEIWQSWRRTCADNADHRFVNELFDRQRLPAFCDPFAGSGSIPLSAQWLGLETYSSDLNPVAVLINKAMIEIPPKFDGMPPVNPESRENRKLFDQKWTGAQGLAEDVRYYGRWMRDEAENRIGHLYPKVSVTAEMAKERPDLRPYVGHQLTVIAWLWARTVKSPNPAFAGVEVPLVSNFMLSTKSGKEAYLDPMVENGTYRFAVRVGKPKNAARAKSGTAAGKRRAFTCLVSGVPISYDYIRNEAKSGRMGECLLTTVAEGARGRVYLSPTVEMETLARSAEPEWAPDCEMPKKHRDFKPPGYGMNNLGEIFTRRQLVALKTFSDLVQESRRLVKRDALSAGVADDNIALNDGGSGASAYADAICTYLACVLDRMVYYGSSLTSWLPKDNALRDCMPRQVLAMTWDYAECNPFGKSSGDVLTCTNSVSNYLDVATPFAECSATQGDAQTTLAGGRPLVVSTDPPYYDNISYADLSDFFYVWLRQSLKPVFPGLFATLTVPKADELVASPNRHGGKEKAEEFFLEGMAKAMHRLAEQAHPAFPVTIYYAFKQSESGDEKGVTNTGWDTFLDGVVRAGFSISGTWPMRTEGAGRMIASGTNALASSIVLVCRPRSSTASTATRREFITALKAELPEALIHLQRGNIAPVDLAQAAIGPGMAVYTRYAKVLDAEGNPLSVREALALINQTLDEALAEQEGDFDADSRWALTWFEQSGFAEGEYGVAEQLSKAKNTSVAGLVEAGIISSKAGKVRLLKPDELPADWDPVNDPRLTAWEMVHHLIRVLEAGGESAASELAARLGAKAEVARELCYRLYTLCERKKRAAEALSYNALVQSWPEIMRLAGEEREHEPGQSSLFSGEEV